MVSEEWLESTLKLEGSHQQGSQEDTERMGQGTGGSGGQTGLVQESSTQDEPGTRNKRNF